MRHPIPIIAAAGTALVISTSMGFGIAEVTGAAWLRFVFLGLGMLLIVLGLRWYQRLASPQQVRVYRWWCVLFLVEFGFVFGGIPGALFGGWLVGEAGELVG